MSEIYIYFSGCSQPRNFNPARYRLAGQSILADSSLKSLASFAVHDELPLKWREFPTPLAELAEPDEVIYEGQGWIGNQWREIRCDHRSNGYFLDVKEVGGFSISSTGDQVVIYPFDPGVKEGDIISVLLGPALILALALQSTWCLHASAILYNDHLLAFLGESGFGKSTLAEYLGIQGGEGWQRVADDLLHLSFAGESLQVHPHFPQLKLPVDQQPSLDLPESTSLKSIYLLNKINCEPQNIEILPCKTFEAFLVLVHHSVATHLFDKKLLAKHLDFCVSAARSVPVRRLDYPHCIESLPVIRERLIEDMSF